MLSNGGDLQASTISANGVIYGSCHCSDGAYQDKYDWGVNLNWSRIDEIKWVGAWDATTGENLHWTPFELSSRRKTGAWALTTDTNGNLWAGGDFILSFTDSTHSQWNGGFARYDKRDNVAPEAPTFLRTSSATASTVTLTWEGVSDAVSYEILRDDRAIGSTQSTSIEVPRGGENRFFVRAVDAAGNRSATTAVYVSPAYGQVDPANPILLDAGATWSYRAENSPAPEDWARTSFDDSQWPTGAAPLGYGDSRIATVLTATGSRPVTSYFRSHFQVADANAIKGVTVRYVADDGAVVYINGHEVDRTRMGSGTVSYQTRADYAPSYGTAVDSMSEVFVPAALLRSGDNVIAVETHVNYMRTATVGMQASIFRVEGTPENNDTHEPSLPTTPQNLGDATQPIDVRGMTSGEVIPSGTTQWNYWTSTSAPASDWAHHRLPGRLVARRRARSAGATRTLPPPSTSRRRTGPSPTTSHAISTWAPLRPRPPWSSRCARTMASSCGSMGPSSTRSVCRMETLLTRPMRTRQSPSPRHPPICSRSPSPRAP